MHSNLLLRDDMLSCDSNHDMAFLVKETVLPVLMCDRLPEQEDHLLLDQTGTFCPDQETQSISIKTDIRKHFITKTN